MAMQLFPASSLSAYAEFGYRFSNDGLIPRLPAAINVHVGERAAAERGTEDGWRSAFYLWWREQVTPAVPDQAATSPVSET